MVKYIRVVTRNRGHGGEVTEVYEYETDQELMESSRIRTGVDIGIIYPVAEPIQIEISYKIKE